MASVGTEEDIFQKAIDEARVAKGQGAPGGAPPGKNGTAAPGGKPDGKAGPAKDFTNPDLKGLSPEKNREAAENLARFILRGYAKGIDYGDQQLQVSEKQMLKIRAAGKIDMSTPIPIEGGEISFEEFIRTYNQQTRGTLTVDQEFIDDVLPRLTSVLAKHGQGLSDEQYLIVVFGANIGYNAQKFMAQKAMLREFMSFGLEMTRRNRETGHTVPAYTPPPAPQRTPPPPPPEAPVVPLYNQQTSSPAAEHFETPTWGAKDKMKTLEKASKRNAKGKGAVARRDLSEAPGKKHKHKRQQQRAL